MSIRPRSSLRESTQSLRRLSLGSSVFSLSSTAATNKWRRHSSSLSSPYDHEHAAPTPPVMFPLPTPVPPASLSLPAPSLGSNNVLPYPKPGRGAPPIDIALVRVAPPLSVQLQDRAQTNGGPGLTTRVKELMHIMSKESKIHEVVHPAVCAEWF
ncbi:hypothetical protein GGX14DRAFT_404389 [Mycena pura]|uniref:Uncharacterized protein n=1 Tax=Mycena pura TaxID=153505 RepID=A0AAD6UUR3_9AGAR|nr:hypothetical protein GGX14DRAFT_404389 [Mycena pura]